MTKILIDEATVRLVLEALQFKNILNSCGSYSTVDVEKAAKATIALQAELAGRTSRLAVPDVIGPNEGEHPGYVEGWNDCRREMLNGGNV